MDCQRVFEKLVLLIAAKQRTTTRDDLGPMNLDLRHIVRKRISDVLVLVSRARQTYMDVSANRLSLANDIPSRDISRTTGERGIVKIVTS